ncbi:MAG: class I SAM-dependent DNA methyltransferase [Armatimonadota bacterium]
MNEPAKFNNVVSFLWAIADLLNGAFQKSEFQKIILPFTVLRRLDYALEGTKAKVLETEHKLKEKGLENRHGQLCRAAGYAFYNTSKFDYESLLHDDANLALNLRQYVMGFSPNVREIFEAFNFDDAIRDLDRAGLLYLLMERFNEKSKVDLRPASMSNHEMGYVFEHLLRKFNEALNQNPGEHFTPREVIRLMVDMVLMFDTDLASGEGVARTVNDCCCGTGGMLTITKDRIQQINPQAKVFLYGQELNPQTWAVARSDMLILEPEGKDAENIKLGSTLSNDQLSDKRFDFQFVNPPYGYEWSKDYTKVTEEAARGFDGRFGAGLPRKSDGQMLFLQHFIARMNDAEDAQSYIGIIMNGSPLFTGGAGSGESEIRRWIMENDWLEAIVALPQQIFYNTGISTYIWLLSNRKPASHRGKVMLVDASGKEFWSDMSKSLGNKRREITESHRQAILALVQAREEGPHLKILETTDFGYREIKVLRPLKLRFEVNAESLARLDAQSTFLNLAVSKKKQLAEQKQDEEEGRALQADIRAVLQTLAGKTYIQRDKFTAALEAALKKAGLKLKAPVLKAILAGIGERDDAAEICRDSDGNPEADSDLNDTENVPLKEKIETYFAREVTPHVPDAWIDPAYCDAKDGMVGRVGYEIPFNRHFYVFQPPRPLSAIDADLKQTTNRILTMIGGLTK